MRSSGVAIAVLAFAVIGAGAQPSALFTREMLAAETMLLAKVGPQTQTWIKQEAARRKTTTPPWTISASSLRTASGLPLSSREIDAVTFLVLTETARANVKDLSALEQKVRESMQDLDSEKSKEAAELQLKMQELTARISAIFAAMSNILKSNHDVGLSIRFVP